MRSIRYRDIATDLRARIDAGELQPGGLLPSEAELSARYDASRVTVRRALDRLRDEGWVESRQGFGWMVAADPLRQDLGRLATIEAQLEAVGLHPERRVVGFAFERAPAGVAEVLGVDQVLRVDRVNLADGAPFARVTVWCPAELAAELSRADVERTSFYELLGLTLGGARQTIAAAASAADARRLQVPEGSPVLRCQRVTTDTGGRPVLVSEHVVPGHRTEFVVDLPSPHRSIAPTGLRLVR